MANPYIPTRDSLLVDWAENFSNKISASPGTYGLTPGDAVAIAALVDGFSDAYALVADPATKTKPVVAAKDAAKAAMLSGVRPYAILIRNNLGVSNQAKLDLGLTVPDPTPTPIPAPTTSPMLTLIGSTPGQLTLRASDQNTPDLRAKPFGVIALHLFAAEQGDSVPTFEDSRYVGTFTRQPMALDTAAFTPGKTLHLWARWVTRTGKYGPWSSSISVIVPAT
jgi:hypothetical protein